jgi:hypothetical protein
VSAAGVTVERAWLFHNWGRNLGEAARLLESSQVLRRQTPEGRGDRGAQARRSPGSPWGGSPPDRWRRGGERESLREEEAQEGSGPSGVGRTAGWWVRTPGTGSLEDGLADRATDDAWFRPPRSAQPAGGQRRGGDGPRERCRRTLEDQAPEGRSPGALRHEIGSGGRAGSKPARGSKPWGRNVAGVGNPAMSGPARPHALKGTEPQERRVARGSKGRSAAGSRE